MFRVRVYSPMSLLRRLGRRIERFRQLTKAAAEGRAEDRPEIRREACGAWIPTGYDRA